MFAGQKASNSSLNDFSVVVVHENRSAVSDLYGTWGEIDHVAGYVRRDGLNLVVR